MTNKSLSKYILDNLDILVPNPKCTLDYNTDYEILIATMLSAQSTDKRVNIVTKELFKYSLEDLKNMPLEKIEEIIKPVGTYHRKAIYIKNIASKLLKDYDGHVPYDRKYVESLSGVGHKTCNVVFSEIFHEPNIPVDTHVTRIAKRLGIAKENDDVLTIEKKLKKLFPKNTWYRLHLQLITFGRDICHAKNPKCDKCSFQNICKCKMRK